LALRETVEFLWARGIDVTIVGQIPGTGWNVPVEMLRVHRFGGALPPALSLAEYRALNAPVNRALAALPRGKPLRIVDLESVFYPHGFPVFSQDGAPLYRDAGHLSLLGTDFVTHALRAALVPVISPASD
jgi:hypothetical protein